MKNVIFSFFALAIAIQPMSAQAKNNKQAVGVIGAIVGGAIANDISGGDNFATFLGVIAGAAIGSSIGEDMDEYSRSEMSVAQARALERSQRGYTQPWYGHNCSGQFVVVNTGYYNSYSCRSYRSEIYTSSGRHEVRSGSTCYGPNGWYEVNESYVQWSY